MTDDERWRKAIVKVGADLSERGDLTREFGLSVLREVLAEVDDKKSSARADLEKEAARRYPLHEMDKGRGLSVGAQIFIAGAVYARERVAEGLQHYATEYRRLGTSEGEHSAKVFGGDGPRHRRIQCVRVRDIG